MEEGHKVRKIVVVLFAVLSFSACTTKTIYIAPDLPAFSPIVPERPELEEIPEDAAIPAAVNINFDLVAGYAEKLETVIDSWEAFYNELKRVYQADRKTAE